MAQVLERTSMRTLIVGAVALLVFLMLIPSFAYAANNKTYTVKVDSGYLALRSKPAYNEKNEIGQLYTGDTVVLKKKLKKKNKRNYWWVYSPKYNKKGYVNKNYLVSTVSYGDYTVKVDKNYLALRTKPAYDAGNEIGQLYTGDKVTVKKKPKGDYWWVYSPKYDEYGWVNKNYLTQAPTTYGDYKVKVEKNYLALRSAPTYAAENEIGKLYSGDTVTVKEKRGQYWWVYSSKHNREGYVNSDYLVKI